MVGSTEDDQGVGRSRRRPRHAILELERVQQEYAARLQQLEKQHLFLTRRARLLAQACQVREHQLKLLSLYGASERAASQRVLRAALPRPHRPLCPTAGQPSVVIVEEDSMGAPSNARSPASGHHSASKSAQLLAQEILTGKLEGALGPPQRLVKMASTSSSLSDPISTSCHEGSAAARATPAAPSPPQPAAAASAGAGATSELAQLSPPSVAWFKLSSKPLPPKASVSHVTSLTIATLSAGGSINTISDLALAAEAVATTASGQLAGPSGGTTSDQPQQQRQMEVEGASAAPQAVVDGRNPSPLPQPSADGDGGGRRAGGGTPSPAAPGDGRAAAEGGGEEVAVGGGGSVAAVQDSWFLARAFSHLPAARVRSEHLEGWDIGEISRVSEQQHYAIYTKVAEDMSALLFQVEGPASEPPSHDAVSKLLHAVEMVCFVGGAAMACSPCMAEATGKPVSPGMEPATDAHWENVVHALKLSPDQMEEVVHLDEMREAWMARAAKEDLGEVGDLLSAMLREAEHSSCKVATAQMEMCTAELLAKVPRALRTRRWITMLMDEMLKCHILTVVQVARFVVHCFPYFPSAAAIVEAAGRIARRQGLGGAAAAPPAITAARERSVPATTTRNPATTTITTTTTTTSSK